MSRVPCDPLSLVDHGRVPRQPGALLAGVGVEHRAGRLAGQQLGLADLLTAEGEGQLCGVMQLLLPDDVEPVHLVPQELGHQLAPHRLPQPAHNTLDQSQANRESRREECCLSWAMKPGLGRTQGRLVLSRVRAASVSRPCRAIRCAVTCPDNI